MRVLRRRLNIIAVSTSIFLVVTFYFLSGGTVDDLVHLAGGKGGGGGEKAASAHLAVPPFVLAGGSGQSSLRAPSGKNRAGRKTWTQRVVP